MEDVARVMLPLGRSLCLPALTATHSRARLTTTCNSISGSHARLHALLQASSGRCIIHLQKALLMLLSAIFP